MNDAPAVINQDKPIRYKVIREYYWKQSLWLGFILLHVILALAMHSLRIASTIHAVLTLLIGLYVVFTTHNPRQVAWVTAYICGAEILWRMTKAGVFWEYGKYAIVLLMVIALLRMRKVKNAGLPILYFILLIISIPLTLFDLPLDTARQAISFNLSGPLCLAVSVLFFSQTKLNAKDREVLSWYLVSPIIGIAVLCVRGIFTAEELIFIPESSFATSGGFGPNQVSAILGLGALFMIVMAIQEKIVRKRVFPVLIALGLITLSALTFSRGGLYNLVASILMIAVFSIRSSKMRKTFLPLLFFTIIAGGFIIYPKLNNFTGGMLESRFADVEATGRIEIATNELELWKKNPIFGVGPGMSAYHLIDEMGKRVAAHTEYTRMLAEHGILGLFSIVILLTMAAIKIIKSPKGLSQGWTAAFVAWSMMEMVHAAMRIAAIGFVFGIGFSLWDNSNNHDVK